MVPPTSDDLKVALAQKVQHFTLCSLPWGLLDKGELLGVLGRDYSGMCCRNFQVFDPVDGAMRVLSEILLMYRWES